MVFGLPGYIHYTSIKLYTSEGRKFALVEVLSCDLKFAPDRCFMDSCPFGMAGVGHWDAQIFTKFEIQ